MLRATDAVAAAYGNSRHGRRASWTTTRFRLALLPATLSLLSVIKNDVCEYLAQRLQSSDVVFNLCADDLGHWSLGLPKPHAVTAAGKAALSLWAEESFFVQMPAHAMGYVMRLSSALGYMLVRAALDGELTEHALRYLFLLLHVICGGVSCVWMCTFVVVYQMPTLVEPVQGHAEPELLSGASCNRCRQQQ